MNLNSKDTQWKGTPTEWLEKWVREREEARTSRATVKFVTKLEKTYVYLATHKNWAYSVDELSDIMEMDRKTVKHVLKLLEKIDAAEMKMAVGEKYYIFKQEMDVLEAYKKFLVKKYRSWRMSSEEIAEDIVRKGLENVGENSAS